MADIVMDRPDPGAVVVVVLVGGRLHIWQQDRKKGKGTELKEVVPTGGGSATAGHTAKESAGVGNRGIAVGAGVWALGRGRHHAVAKACMRQRHAVAKACRGKGMPWQRHAVPKACRACVQRHAVRTCV